ncbi:MAG: RodZ domain-containing protein [Vicinamibacterales bacterium]
MSTGESVRPISGGRIPDFHMRWRGYDQEEVDQFVKEITADRQRRRAASLDPLSPGRQTERAEEVVTMARRHADEIRMTAEREADRILREAERRAALLASEQLDANRRDYDRIAGVRRDLEGCLETAVSALERVRGAATLGDRPEGQVPADSEVSMASTSATEPAAGASSDRFRKLYWIALIVWSVFLLSIVLMVTIPPVDRSTAARASVVDDLDQRPVVSDDTAPAAPVSSVSAAQSSDLSITLVASQECWLSIATDGGAPREHLLKPSEKIVVQAQDAVTLTAGNAGALSVMINDQPAAPLGLEKQVVTRRITRANYREFLVSTAG